MSAPTRERTPGSAFQPWMIANFAMGAGFSAFVALLIPPYVSELTGDATAAGVVMAVISLAAVLGPVIGTLAHRYRAHRLLLSGGVLGMSIGFAAFALSADSANLYAIDAILIGVSISAVSAVGPVFIVGAKLPQDLEARRMTAYSLAMPAGQVVGGAIIGVAAKAGWSFSDRFWIAAVVMFIVFAGTWLTSKRPEQALHAAMYGEDPSASGDGDGDVATKARSTPLKAVLWSSFGIFLVVSVLTSMANNGINNQISNIMPNVYGVSEAETSTLIAVAGVLNMILFFPAGKLMAKRGALPVYSLGVV
ncbi:MAG: MFS transporter, partial [Acidimicrobiales bacterium]